MNGHKIKQKYLFIFLDRNVSDLSVVVLTDMMVETSSLICVKLGCSMRRRSTAIRFRAVLS